ncbi:hypothetical protein KSW92_04255 [Prevotella copri]|nr:hypothetical protein [Segatella copri]
MAAMVFAGIASIIPATVMMVNRVFFISLQISLKYFLQRYKKRRNPPPFSAESSFFLRIFNL